MKPNRASTRKMPSASEVTVTRSSSCSQGRASVENRRITVVRAMACTSRAWWTSAYGAASSQARYTATSPNRLIGGPALTSDTKSDIGTLRSASLDRSRTRPACHVVSSVKMTAATASGNQPPCRTPSDSTGRTTGR